MKPFRFFHFERSRRDRPEPTPADAMLPVLDAALRARRQNRAERQTAAERREAAKHHARFINDPIIRALRPDLITQGEK